MRLVATALLTLVLVSGCADDDEHSGSAVTISPTTTPTTPAGSPEALTVTDDTMAEIEEVQRRALDFIKKSEGEDGVIIGFEPLLPDAGWEADILVSDAIYEVKVIGGDVFADEQEGITRGAEGAWDVEIDINEAIRISVAEPGTQFGEITFDGELWEVETYREGETASTYVYVDPHSGDLVAF